MYQRNLDHLEKVKAGAAKEQPRQAVDRSNRRALPYEDPLPQLQSLLFRVLPLDCRLLIWEHVLQPSQTRIERWRCPNKGQSVSGEESDANCFPYRLATAGVDKTEKPLNLLLCCRRLYIESLPIPYSTTFVFEMPLDVYNFQLCASPEGLSSVQRLVIALGQINWPGSGPFFSRGGSHPNGSLDEWENALHGLERMRGLQELHVWLGHPNVQPPELERRPWKEHQGIEELERRHNKLFDLFGTVDVPHFTVHLTWKPDDVLSRRQQWPFQIQLYAKNEMWDIVNNKLPDKTEPDLYDWYNPS